MTVFRCVGCRTRVFEATRLSFESMELKCRRCKHVGTPRPVGPLYAEFECPRCDLLSVRIAAPDALDYCVRCGVQTTPIERAGEVVSPRRTARRA